MTFIKRKKSPPSENKKPVKSHVVSVRLNDEEHRQVKEKCRLSGRKISDFWRQALLKANVIQVATPEDMALLRQIGSMSNSLNQLAKRANDAGFKVVKWELENLAKDMKSLYLKLSDDWKHQ